MAAKVKRILVTLRFIFVLKSILTICALVLFLLFVGPGTIFSFVSRDDIKISVGNYLKSSSVSNFLGFFGQHSHMKPPPVFPACMVSEDFRGVRICLDS